ncbi:MAG: hypothetical protein WCI74_00645 [Actinomycetes bacterium]
MTALDRFRSMLWLCVAGVVVWVALVTRHGAPWGQTVGIASLGVMLFVFSQKRRFLKLAIARSNDGIICRWVPWYDSNLILIFLMGLFGVAMCSAGPGAGRVLGFLALALVLPSLYFAVPMWRKAILVIGPSTLSLRLPRRGSQLTKIPRERIESITPKTSYVGGISANAILFILLLPGGRNSLNTLQVEIVYTTAESPSASTTVLIGMPARKNGMQVCVKSVNLLQALLVWKEGSIADPTKLLAQVESILRGDLAPADSSRTYAGYFSS